MRLERKRRHRGAVRCCWVVPAGIFGTWTVAAAQHGTDSMTSGDMTLFLLALAAILVAAKLGGELAERVNQPAVLGELLVGIVLGNLGLVNILAFESLKTAPFLPIAAEIGVILLLFQVGLRAGIRGDHPAASLKRSSSVCPSPGLTWCIRGDHPWPHSGLSSAACPSSTPGGRAGASCTILIGSARRGDCRWATVGPLRPWPARRSGVPRPRDQSRSGAD